MKRVLLAFLMFLLSAGLSPASDRLDSPVSIELRDAELKDVLADMGKLYGLRVIVDERVSGRITASLRGIPLRDALHSMLAAKGCAYRMLGDDLLVVKPLHGTAKRPERVRIDAWLVELSAPLKDTQSIKWNTGIFGTSGKAGSVVDKHLMGLRLASLAGQGKASVTAGARHSVRASEEAKILEETEVLVPPPGEAGDLGAAQRPGTLRALLALTVTPEVTDEGHVLMTIESRVTGGEAEPGPPRTAMTAITLRPGETAVIGGIYTEDRPGRQESFLARVPLIGRLWRNESAEPTELMLFLTPEVAAEEDQAPAAKALWVEQGEAP